MQKLTLLVLVVLPIILATICFPSTEARRSRRRRTTRRPRGEGSELEPQTSPDAFMIQKIFKLEKQIVKRICKLDGPPPDCEKSRRTPIILLAARTQVAGSEAFNWYVAIQHGEGHYHIRVYYNYYSDGNAELQALVKKNKGDRIEYLKSKGTNCV